MYVLIGGDVWQDCSVSTALGLRRNRTRRGETLSLGERWLDCGSVFPLGFAEKFDLLLTSAECIGYSQLAEDISS
ncbi:hypothetical protein HOLleu_33027 [Holothuria leucospilota]|uniref:Uncharacterized protein n=1 Tax=Holothuria leucospilota TaxID=206669 RepID=A0A9Q0YN47_HOLLE|nr:hypothetical protein HOLleu_33027 [Holothuria leucospilota]